MKTTAGVSREEVGCTPDSATGKMAPKGDWARNLARCTTEGSRAAGVKSVRSLSDSSSDESGCSLVTVTSMGTPSKKRKRHSHSGQSEKRGREDTTPKKSPPPRRVGRQRKKERRYSTPLRAQKLAQKRPTQHTKGGSRHSAGERCMPETHRLLNLCSVITP